MDHGLKRGLVTVKNGLDSNKLGFIKELIEENNEQQKD